VPMNMIDCSVFSFLDQFEGKSALFDKVVNSIYDNGFLRGAIIVGLCWYAWFKNGENVRKNKKPREILLATLIACFVSILLARLIVMAFPFRLRPMCDPSVLFHFAATAKSDWVNWSSFPSDHAIMFFTLTTGLFFISRTMGFIALLDTVFLVCLPRIYLGIHYPTDILAGAAIGIIIGLAANGKAVRVFLSKAPLWWLKKSPGSFYAFFFLFMSQLSVIFFDVRHVVLGLLKTALKMSAG
jgi:undecaprenyl-diphosphatase